MHSIPSIFTNIEKLTRDDGQQEFLSSLLAVENQGNAAYQHDSTYLKLKLFLLKIIKEIDNLTDCLQKDETILISVKNQKLLRTCYQIITSIGISQCLLPGLGITLSRRCASASILPSINLTDEQKYEMLTEHTDFFTRSYNIPVLKKIILTLHLSDYLAALIQLAFAPLKKPGTYSNFTMTVELYDKLKEDRKKYIHTYEYLVANCFQPTLMKELLVLQSVTEPSPPMFVKRVIAKEMSRRLLAPGGLLSLVRCFMESYEIDTGFDWRKIDMICKIVSSRHGTASEELYLNNICSQLAQILALNNTHYLTTSIACILSVYEKFPEANPVKDLVKDIFQAFDYNSLTERSSLPSTIIFSPQEIEHKVNIFNAYLCLLKHDFSISLMSSNIPVLFLLGMQCSKNEELKIKLKDILVKCFDQFEKTEITPLLKECLFGKNGTNMHIKIEEYDAGLAIKYISTEITYPKEDALMYLLHLLKSSSDNNFVQYTFDVSLSMLIELDSKRKGIIGKEKILSPDDEPNLIGEVDQEYVYILQLLSELATSPKIIACLKTNPSMVLNFIEYFIVDNQTKINDECVTIALVLLNTILSNSKKSEDLEQRFMKLIPILKKLSSDDSCINNILCKEALCLITAENIKQRETKFEKALSDIFDDLMPVRAHGIIAMTKLIDAKDAETISKKHYIFCMFQEHLKDPDSYMYLSAINGISALGTHCPDDVLNLLCKEFLQMSIDENDVETKLNQNKVAELRMKIGDIIVKVTRRLGEMAIVHKTTLLNTMLCGCRDEDPLIRASALSNLAEIALVLNYKIGSIIYELLLCVWSILESDKAIECRRAAVMVISSLIKGLGRDVLLELKDNLLPIYRTLKDRYNDENEDSVLRLHAQIALEELNDIVKQFVFPEVKMNKQIFVLE